MVDRYLHSIAQSCAPLIGVLTRTRPNSRLQRTIALFTNRVAVGGQVAAVHGLPVLAGAPAILLAIVMSVLVVLGINSKRAWGYWLTMAYMAFLLAFPPLALGMDRILMFANVIWPAVMVVYLYLRRGRYGVGHPVERPTKASS